MEKPYLKLLEYELRTSDELSFDNPDTLKYEDEEIELTLEENVLRLIPKISFESIEEATSYFQGFIRSWEIDFALEIGCEIEFKFRNAEFEKENNTLTAVKGDYIHVGEEISIKRTLNSYPDPNPDFKVSDKVQNMYLRYRQYRDGKETLLSMAYYCLTELEDLAGGRKNISSKLKISSNVIRNYGRIISSGGKVAPRKAKHRSITESEIQWIQKLIPKLIKQLGKYEAGKLQAEDKITNDDLPTI